jgi:hypothetical protein
MVRGFVECYLFSSFPILDFLLGLAYLVATATAIGIKIGSKGREDFGALILVTRGT